MNQSGLKSFLLKNEDATGQIGQVGELLVGVTETGGLKFTPGTTEAGGGNQYPAGGLVELEVEFTGFGTTHCTRAKLESDYQNGIDCIYVLEYNDGGIENFHGGSFTLEEARDSKPGEPQLYLLKASLHVSKYEDAVIQGAEEPVIPYTAPVTGGNIILNDVVGSHATGMINGINLGFGSNISSRVVITPGSFSNALLACIDNNGMAVIKSTIGLQGFIYSALNYYQDCGICSFVPLGSNDPIQIYLNPDEIPVIVTSGAGDTDNDTAFGNGLEFWDDDTDGNPAVDASSFSNGTVLGKLLKIKETLTCTWWEARYRARQTASGGGTWSINNGYGKIDVSAAIAWSGTVPADPYL